jgi:hypothetical protein
MKAWEIIEAIDDPSGLIHPEKHQAIAGRTHPLGGHPAYPEHRAGPGEHATNYEEVLATRQWQKILQKGQQYLGVPLTRQALGTIQQKLIQSMRLIAQAEATHKEELEALAIELVFELPEFKSAKKAYEANRIQIDAELTEEPSMEGGMTSDEPEAQKPLSQERTPAEKQWIEKMIQRRHFTNALIQGSAVSNNYLFELGGQALDRIHPGLRKAYGTLMVSTEIGYWMFPQSAVIAGARAELQVGSAKVGFTDEEEPEQAEQPEEQPPPQRRMPKVTAQAMHFPVLIQEIIKGLTELASLPSLPRDPEERQEVLSKADLVDMEAWHMILGPQLWDQFVAITDAENERELAMHLYSYIQRMGVDEFNGFMKELYAKSPRGMQMLRQLAQRVKADMAEAEGDDVRESAQEIVRALIG